MKIRVTLPLGGQIFAEPNFVKVLAGEPIIWEFVSDVPNQPLISWLVYFAQRSPFPGPALTFAVDSRTLPVLQSVGPISSATHLAATRPVIAQQPGDYKYGIRATVPRTGQILGDDDPLISVIP